MPIGASIWGPIVAAGVGGAIASHRRTTSSVNPAYGPLQQQILAMIQKRLAGGYDLSGYQAGGIQDINNAYDLVGQSSNNNLTARGLSTSPVAANVDAIRTTGRAGSIGRFNASLPLVQRQMQAEDLGLAGQILGYGRQTEETSGGGAAGSAENIAQMLGYLYSKGAFKRGGAGGGNGSYYEPNDVNGWG